MLRPDGSVRSTNTPIAENRYAIRDYGIYRGVIREVIYTDDDNNDSKDSNEVVYNVMIIGGDRDGQIFNNARLMRTLGGFGCFEEITLKATGGVSKLDLANPLAQTDPSINNLNTLNGDVVFIAFLSGDPHLPLIVGLGYHQSSDPEATEDDGPRYIRQFNGIRTEITKDGEFTWSKDNGSFVPVLPNPSNPLAPFINQFAPLPGQEQAVTVTLDNQYLLTLSMIPGLTATFDGLKDNFSFATAAGATMTVDGVKDNFSFATTVGTAFTIDGPKDILDLATSAGAELKVDGINDAITLDVAFGDSFSVTAKDGIQASTPTGTSLSMKNGQVDIASGGAAALSLTKTGFVKLGNSSGDVFKDILMELLKSLSTATYAGFGAPGSNVADFIQLITKLQLIIGG